MALTQRIHVLSMTVHHLFGTFCTKGNMDKELLEKIMECLTIMAIVDGTDESELMMIKNMVQGVWDGSPEELEQSFKQVQKAVETAHQQGELDAMFEQAARRLAALCDHGMRGVAERLMMKLMKADNKISGPETNYFMKFKKYLREG